MLRLAGFTRGAGHVELAPGPRRADRRASSRSLRNVEAAARLSGVKVYVSVYHPGSRDDAARRPTAQTEFAAVRGRARDARCPTFDDVIVGNEPNLNRFWLPQFDARRHERVGARLPRAARPDLRRAQGGRPDAARLGRRARAARRRPARRHAAATRPRPPLSSRTLGAAYRASGRTLPVMDGFAFHPYPDNSSQCAGLPRTRARRRSGSPTTTSSSRCSREAFDGTAQAGSTLPILYDEFGIESIVPDGKASLYTGTEPATTKPGRRGDAGGGLRPRRCELAFCQPNVAGILLFHSHDERALASWQSGVYYADGDAEGEPSGPCATRSTRARRLDRAAATALALDVRLTNSGSPGQRGVPTASATSASAARSTARGSSSRRDDDGRRRRRVRGHGR